MDAPAVFRVLEGTTGLLRRWMEVIPGEVLQWRPGPDRWSIAMVVAHLADVEEKGFMGRFRALVEEEDPFLASYNQLALFQKEQQWDAWEQLGKLEEKRQGTLEWLKALPEGVRSRSGRHEELGVMTLENLLQEFAFHDLGHLRQVAELWRARAFYPEMGAFQRYYRVNP